MTHIDLDDLKTRVFFETASHDDRFVWQEIFPVRDVQHNLIDANPGLTAEQFTELGRVGVIYGPDTDPRWADGFRRFRIIRCAHREVDRVNGDQCGHCGADNPYEPPAEEAARKRRAQ
jgi:hypothetical protein